MSPLELHCYRKAELSFTSQVKMNTFKLDFDIVRTSGFISMANRLLHILIE